MESLERGWRDDFGTVRALRDPLAKSRLARSLSSRTESPAFSPERMRNEFDRQETFDRLYANGYTQTVRRRVYGELAKIAERVVEDSHPFQPNPEKVAERATPNAKAVSDRLYVDAARRKSYWDKRILDRKHELAHREPFHFEPCPEFPPPKPRKRSKPKKKKPPPPPPEPEPFEDEDMGGQMEIDDSQGAQMSYSVFFWFGKRKEVVHSGSIKMFITRIAIFLRYSKPMADIHDDDGDGAQDDSQEHVDDLLSRNIAF